MNLTHCPGCQRTLSSATTICTYCGQILAISQRRVSLYSTFLSLKKVRSVFLRAKKAFRVRGVGISDRKIERQKSTVVPAVAASSRLTPLLPLTIEMEDLEYDDPNLLEEEEEGDKQRESTWHKVVELPPPAESVSYPPRPVLSTNSRPSIPAQKKLWHKPYTPKYIFYIALIVLLFSMGTVGVLSTLGYMRSPVLENDFALEALPHQVAVGGTLSLRGMGFSPQAQIGLTRDNMIAIATTSGETIIYSDKEGFFSDTVVVSAEWGIGAHTLHAQDSITHKTATFPIVVTGQGQPLRPAYLNLSTTKLDLGAGDVATNSKQTIKLTNGGSGQIQWQGKSDQSWLQITPQSGSFYSDTNSQVTIAVNRADLKIGDYTGKVRFSSNAGDATLEVKMKVTPFVAQQGILQVSPSVLSFAATDGGENPKAQSITLRNPGTQPFNWEAQSNQSWLKLQRTTGTLAVNAETSIQVQVDIRHLLPGTHRAMITVWGSNGQAAQTVEVTVTIGSQCMLIIDPGLLTFKANRGQNASSVQVVDITSSSSCSQPMEWTSKSSASWVVPVQQKGTTPQALQIQVNSAGLSAGTHTATVELSSATGTQTLLVQLIVSEAPTLPPTCSYTLSTGGLAFQGQVGKQVATQNVSIISGSICDQRINWYAQTGASWLRLSSDSGSIDVGGSGTLGVTPVLDGLKAGTYNGLVTFNLVEAGTGRAMGQKEVLVSLTVSPPPILSVETTALSFTEAGSRTITIRNSGSGTLTWNASLDVNAPSFVTLGSTSGVLNEGETTNIVVNVNPASGASGTYTTNVVITGINSSGSPVAGSPGTVPISIALEEPPPVLDVSPTVLMFTINEGNNPASKAVQLYNTGGGVLSWTSNTPSQSWLLIGSAGGTIVSGSSESLIFAVDATGLMARSDPYVASVVIMSTGNSVTLTVTLRVNAPLPPINITIPMPTPIDTITELPMLSLMGMVRHAEPYANFI